MGIYAIQEDINPKDLNMFEQYWIEQFPNLLNTGAPKRLKGTPTAQKIIEAVQGTLPRRQRKRR